MVHANQVGPVVIALMNAQCYQAFHFLSNKLVIRATKPRCRVRKKQWNRHDRSVNFVLTIGEPNYYERQLLRRKGLPEGIQLRDFPRSR